ncbi:hypothetical protein [Solibacillus sp. FSL H8-0538]|uniref:hypothetical protein n=1 Tax=Solibacillus sp. FSL H8-0538 TaxID=2921400 RepID=UPI0030F5061D
MTKKQPDNIVGTGRRLDNPDLVDTENESLFDMHEDMQTVDAIPIEELNEKVKDEKNKDHTKSTSATDKLYPNSLAYKNEEL